MKIHRSHVIKAQHCEQFQQGSWNKMDGETKLDDCIIISELSDVEHDAILNISDGIDNYGLRGYTIRLIVENKQSDDIDKLELVTIPNIGHIMGNGDNYYVVKKVLHNTSMEIVALVRRLGIDELVEFFTDRVVEVKK